MIFAGDFAQLPPPIGGENVSLYSHLIGRSLGKLKQQEEAFGKALWHQVVTVVILRQNMRQKTQSEDDAQFRTALENMRYRACTAADIQFLRSRISTTIQGRPSVCDANFRNVSIITARHINKDAINDLGEQRFASEHGVHLSTFYCEDSVAPLGDSEEVKGKKRAAKRLLWEQPACSVEKKIPGKLNLCKGLPVMLRNNSATELCMTNGQEDLPTNVVPIMRTATPTWCDLPSGKRLHVSRNQVEITVNYAMTDFASQGKTRINNVVHLNDTTTHQGYYTALSRSASAAGTLILQGFNATLISDHFSLKANCQMLLLEIQEEH
ncbi:hypothetical protein PLEOSDRAFT_1074087 [Pleurotus ostreatus PC15]|uniref:ATP-dependent DNA helicase n=1 Tax=Pleurotus ostreatus (strain PC15) TaxID=1137138 RepID=A0A067PDP1_PLEO1|nr:hypothetical protein PLEOSDRAFT_1074087 [Pleurotus ostreatus PC15]